MTTHGAGVRAIFTVSATVPARATLDVISQPTSISVSDEDVARGYLDVAAVYRVRNNDPAGYLLRLVPLTGLTSSIEVNGLASAVLMGEDTVEVTQPPALQAQRPRPVVPVRAGSRRSGRRLPDAGAGIGHDTLKGWRPTARVRTSA